VRAGTYTNSCANDRTYRDHQTHRSTQADGGAHGHPLEVVLPGLDGVVAEGDPGDLVSAVAVGDVAGRQGDGVAGRGLVRVASSREHGGDRRVGTNGRDR